MSRKDSEPSCCSTTESSVASTELKLYQTFIFSVPIFFTFVLLFLFYLFYLRRRRADWSSLRMRTTLENTNDISRAELGLKKELREMLPIIIYKESFSIKDTQCSVCLGDYQAEDRLQQIPACGHTFHMDCIDHWLAIHTTCPLCRLSLLASAKPSTESPDAEGENETTHEPSVADGGVDTYFQHRPQAREQTPATEESNSRNAEAGVLQPGTEDGRSLQSVDDEKEYGDARNETKMQEHSCGFSGTGKKDENDCFEDEKTLSGSYPPFKCIMAESWLWPSEAHDERKRIAYDLYKGIEACQAACMEQKVEADSGIKLDHLRVLREQC